ncbi:MAG: hypothetical protein J1F36_06435 [Clostridiales bacterium]|nr:hypothetical protein [Clostridiales bacterium]
MKPEIGDKTVHIVELISALAVAITGIFLTLTGLNVFPFSIDKCWLMSVYICLFIISLAASVAQKNAIGIFFCCIFALLIIAQTFVLIGYSHRTIYPIYIIAIPFGCIGGALQSPYARKVCLIMLAIIGAGLLLLLESTGVLSIKIILPLIAAYFGVLGVIYATVLLKKDNLHNKEYE